MQACGIELGAVAGGATLGERLDVVDLDAVRPVQEERVVDPAGRAATNERACRTGGPTLLLRADHGTLQKFGFERGRRSKPNSLLSASKPLLTRGREDGRVLDRQPELHASRRSRSASRSCRPAQPSTTRCFSLTVPPNHSKPSSLPTLACTYSTVVPRPSAFCVSTFSSLSGLKIDARELDAREAECAAGVVGRRYRRSCPARAADLRRYPCRPGSSPVLCRAARPRPSRRARLRAAGDERLRAGEDDRVVLRSGRVDLAAAARSRAPTECRWSSAPGTPATIAPGWTVRVAPEFTNVGPSTFADGTVLQAGGP